MSLPEFFISGNFEVDKMSIINFPLMSAAEDLSTPASEVGSDAIKGLLESLRQVDHSELQALHTRSAVQGSLASGKGYLAQPLQEQRRVPITPETVDWRRAPLVSETIQ